MRRAGSSGSLWKLSMKMRFNLLRLTILLLTPLLLLPAYVASAQEDSKPPLETQLTLDRATLKVGESTQAILVLRNTSPYTLTGVSAQLRGTTFNLLTSTDLPDTLSPQSSTQAEYLLQSQLAGSHNAVFVVQYSWNDSSGASRQWLEAVSIEGIEIIPWLDFKWPDYLIPESVTRYSKKSRKWGLTGNRQPNRSVRLFKMAHLVYNKSSGWGITPQPILTLEVKDDLL
jgi:hypothetical protein